MQVLIVDSSVQVIQRLEEMLLEMKKIRTVFKAVSYEEAVNFFKNNRLSVVLLDSRLKENGTIRLLNHLKETGSDVYTIVLSTCNDEYILMECKSLNIDIILDKYQEFEKIPDLINSISVK